MPTDHEALEEFRKSIIEALADIQVQVTALELAVEEGAPKTPLKLAQCKKTAKSQRHELVARYSDEIRLSLPKGSS